MSEQRYQAVLKVISDGETVSKVAARFGVACKTVQARREPHQTGGSR